MQRTFENCRRFTYTGRDFVFDHFRCGFTDLWRSERRDRYGNVEKFVYRTDEQMRPLFQNCKSIYDCQFYSALSSNSEFSAHSC